VRVAGADRRMTPDAMLAYAIVTARHLVVDDAHNESLRSRHQHRLVDYTTLDGPEQLTLEREETDALAAALERLDREDRALLVRHESEGVPTDVLAAEAGVSKGAVAMRLARARATLRLEFVLAFRRVTLPTSRCRQVLLAFAAGDRRRQHSLGAADHLLACAICASLARPVTERRRGIAAWLLIPVAEGVRRAVSELRHNRLVHGTATAMVATAAVITGVVLAQPDGLDEATPAAVTTAPTAQPSTAPVSAAPATVPATVPAAAPTALAPPPPNPPCPASLPLDQAPADLAPGCPFAPTTVTVIEVPDDEGFWVRTAGGGEVWVHLVGAGESPVTIEPGMALTVVGTVGDPSAVGPVSSDPRLQAGGLIVEVAFPNATPG